MEAHSTSACHGLDATECRGDCLGRRDSQSSLSTVDSESLSQAAEACADSQTQHQEMFSENCIIFDFDDTLFPTSHILDHCPRLWRALADEFSAPGAARGSATRGRPELAAATVEELARSAIALLRLAASLGKVCVVTMAERGWVESCCAVLMPEVLRALEQLGIPIFYAKETAPKSSLWSQSGPRCARKASKEGLCVSQFCKERAMKRALRSMSRGRRGDYAAGCWRGVLSIGDSEAERRALQEVVFREAAGDGRTNLAVDCCKVIKFLENPSLDAMTAQLQILTSWLPRLLSHDADIDIDFAALAASDEDTEPLAAGASGGWPTTCRATQRLNDF